MLDCAKEDELELLKCEPLETRIAEVCRALEAKRTAYGLAGLTAENKAWSQAEALTQKATQTMVESALIIVALGSQSDAIPKDAIRGKVQQEIKRLRRVNTVSVAAALGCESDNVVRCAPIINLRRAQCVRRHNHMWSGQRAIRLAGSLINDVAFASSKERGLKRGFPF